MSLLKSAPLLLLLPAIALGPITAHAFGNANAKLQLHVTEPFTSQA